MPADTAPTISQSIEIDAAPQRVWSLVKDPRNMCRWSPQTWKSFLLGDQTVQRGSTFLNINKRGILVWPTRTNIVRFDEGSEIAWRVKENFTIWSLQLTPNTVGGTTLRQSREAPQGFSDLSVSLTKRFLGGLEAFAAELQRDMGNTLNKIKAEAEKG